jgi:hypothetical protein
MTVGMYWIAIYILECPGYRSGYIPHRSPTKEIPARIVLI